MPITVTESKNVEAEEIFFQVQDILTRLAELQNAKKIKFTIKIITKDGDSFSAQTRLTPFEVLKD